MNTKQIRWSEIANVHFSDRRSKQAQLLDLISTRTALGPIVSALLHVEAITLTDTSQYAPNKSGRAVLISPVGGSHVPGLEDHIVIQIDQNDTTVCRMGFDKTSGGICLNSVMRHAHGTKLTSQAIDFWIGHFIRFIPPSKEAPFTSALDSAQAREP